MSPTGKMNRKILAEIGGSFSAQLAEMLIAGRGPKRQPTPQTKRLLQDIWAQVLKIETTAIGLDDSFFKLGGNSITAMKLVGEARKVGVNLAVADIFRRETLVAAAR